MNLAISIPKHCEQKKYLFSIRNKLEQVGELDQSHKLLVHTKNSLSDFGVSMLHATQHDVELISTTLVQDKNFLVLLGCLWLCESNKNKNALDVPLQICAVPKNEYQFLTLVLGHLGHKELFHASKDTIVAQRLLQCTLVHLTRAPHGIADCHVVDFVPL